MTRDLIARDDDHTETVANGNVALIFEGKAETVHIIGMSARSLSVEKKETVR